ncbi:hypothetical protein OIU91_19745 [Streptomyces sp. NBC_01456]|uniref:hypothetical protein n=1 Tax=Streptomyces sp. NBC_01456 TaxID=2975868 RepID=UPI002E363C52|nr:hypothetical protein [Streptomyces sp. NBC_01456]
MRRTNEREQARTARRDTLLVLLSRAERGVLSRPEAALLRTAVEAELAAGDQARRAAGGQQAAVRRTQQRLVAAEQAIRETEAERDEHAETLKTAAGLAAVLCADFPGEAWSLAKALRALCAGELTPQQTLDSLAH